MIRVLLLTLLLALLGGCASLEYSPTPQILQERLGSQYLDASKVLPAGETMYFAEHASTVPLPDSCSLPDGYGYYSEVEGGFLFITEVATYLVSYRPHKIIRNWNHVENPIKVEFLQGFMIHCIITTDKEGTVITFMMGRSKTAVKIVNYFVEQSI